MKKIREVDDVMTPELQGRVFEAHPEVSFALMDCNRPVVTPKRLPAGRDERVRLLEPFFAGLREHLVPAPGARVDEVIDAYACLWTARRIARGIAW